MILNRQPPAKIAVLAILSLGIVFCIAACQEATKLRDLQADARVYQLENLTVSQSDAPHVQ